MRDTEPSTGARSGQHLVDLHVVRELFVEECVRNLPFRCWPRFTGLLVAIASIAGGVNIMHVLRLFFLYIDMFALTPL